MAFWLTAYRESGDVAQCPTPFYDLEAAKFCAELALHHFGPDYTIIVEEDEDGAEPQLRPADHLAARDTATHDPSG